MVDKGPPSVYTGRHNVSEAGYSDSRTAKLLMGENLHGSSGD